MTGFRADWRRIAASLTVVATAGLGFAGDATWAQSRGPVLLVPQQGGTAEPEPSPGQPSNTPAGEVQPLPGTSSTGIRIQGLDDVGAAAVGLSEYSDPGLDADMWAGTSNAIAIRLIEALPSRMASEAAHALARGVLLVAAKPPEGSGGDLGLIESRAEALIALGAPEAAGRLLSAVSARQLPEKLVEVAARARLLSADFAGACEAIGSVERGLVTEFGQKVLIFCQLLAQEYSQASLGLELLREQNLAQDELFFELAHAIANTAEPSDELLADPGRASALNFAMLRLAGTDFPAWFAGSDAPSVSRAVAQTTEASREVRLAAARNAGRWGALSPVELADVYDGVGIGGDEIASTLIDPNTASGAQRLAVIYLASDQQNIAVARAETLRELWRLAETQKDWRLAVRLTSQRLGIVEPAPVFSWFAGDAMAAHLAAGEFDRALDWFRVASGRSAFDPAAATAAVAMWPALRLASGSRVANSNTQQVRRTVATITLPTRGPAAIERVPWSEQRLAQWIAHKAQDGPEGASAIATQLALFDAMGEQVSNAAWVRAADAEAPAAPFPSTDLWVKLQRAAANGNVAETALYALQTVGEYSLADMHPAALHGVVAALSEVGLADTAHAFAVEAVVTGSP